MTIAAQPDGTVPEEVHRYLRRASSNRFQSILELTAVVVVITYVTMLLTVRHLLYDRFGIAVQLVGVPRPLVAGHSNSDSSEELLERSMVPGSSWVWVSCSLTSRTFLRLLSLAGVNPFSTRYAS